MHIALNAYFWNRPNSGSGQYTRQLVYHLHRLVSDLAITLVIPQVAGEAPPEAVPPGVNIKLVPVKRGSKGKVMFEQRQFPQAYREVGADLAHIPYWGAPLRSPVPLVVTVHDLTTMLVPEYRKSLSARLYNALVASSARGANHIITDSLASKKDIIEHLNIPQEQVTAIYLGVSHEFSPDENLIVDMGILRKYDLPDFYILYLGGYELHKNVMTLLLAWSYVGQALGEDYPLALAGRKPDAVSDVYPDYDDYIKRLRIEEYVRWIGYVDEADKPTLYRQAELFVFPSQYEGFGLPVLEAMASGTPVVTTDSASLPEVVGEAGFAVAAQDARAMAGAIIAGVIQDDLAADLRQKGLARARQFSWEETAKETLLVYDKVMRAG
ncbi:MAG: glycosyltransferase family 4 protein [Chloroflexi bacterium]|nr:glycosyltransferase family 4 protein [Chloroflexota bacterium]